QPRGPCGGHQQTAPFPCLTPGGRDAYRVSANRLGDVLDAMAPQRMVVEIELVPDLFVDIVGDADRARTGESLKAGGDVDAITENVAAVDDDIAEIDTDSEFETPVGRHGPVDAASRLLDLDGAVQRLNDTGKTREEAVARRANDPPAVRRDQRVDSTAELAEPSMRARFVLAHQAAEADDICMQNGG